MTWLWILLAFLAGSLTGGGILTLVMLLLAAGHTGPGGER